MATMREQSKENWNSNSTIQEINAGSLQRIADATEKMAGNYIKLQNDLDMYKRWYYQQVDYVHKRDKTISSLRGQITKLKKKISSSEVSNK